MPMTLLEIEDKIERMERELQEMRASLDYQQSVAAIRTAVATIDEGKGRPIAEVVADIRQRSDAARAATAAQ